MLVSCQPRWGVRKPLCAALMQSSKAFTTVGMGFLLSLGPSVAIAAVPDKALEELAQTPLVLHQPELRQPVARLVPMPEPISAESAPKADTTIPVEQVGLVDKNLFVLMARDEGAVTTEGQLAPAAPTPIDAAEVVVDAIAPPETQPIPESAQSIDLEPAPVDDLSTEQFLIDAEVAFPEYLESDPNPLSFPTQPEEVRLEGMQPITLQQAIAIAERNNPDLAAARLELDRNRAALQEQRAALWPQLRVGAELTFREGQQQRTIERINPFTGDVEFSDEGDELDSVLGGSVRVDYNLFTSGRRSAQIDTAERQLQFQELQVEVLTEQLRLDVATDYYNLQRTDEQLRIRQDALAQAEQNLQDAQALERAGVGTRFDVLQAQVDVANRQQELTRALSEQQVARRQLARRLDLAHTMNLSAADPIVAAEAWPLGLEESIVLAFRNRAELEQRLVERELGEAQRRAAISQYGPQVSLFGQYSTQNVLNNDDNDFVDDYRFGVQLDWALFDGGAARAQARQQEINVGIAEENFASARDTVRFQVEQAFLNFQANQTNIATAELNVERAAESLRLARLRFQAGVGTQSDVLRAQTELTQAEFNRVEAILGYNESLANLRRAVSNWPNLELSDRP